jgi:hypothetical protein
MGISLLFLFASCWMSAGPIDIFVSAAISSPFFHDSRIHMPLPDLSLSQPPFQAMSSAGNEVGCEIMGAHNRPKKVDSIGKRNKCFLQDEFQYDFSIGVGCPWLLLPPSVSSSFLRRLLFSCSPVPSFRGKANIFLRFVAKGRRGLRFESFKLSGVLRSCVHAF